MCLFSTIIPIFSPFSRPHMRQHSVSRIFNACEVRIENSVTRVTVQHHETSWTVIRVTYFQFTPNNHYRFFFLHTLPSTIVFKLEYALFYQFYLEITTFKIKFYGMHTIAEWLLSYNVTSTSFNVIYTQSNNKGHMIHRNLLRGSCNNKSHMIHK